MLLLFEKSVLLRIYVLLEKYFKYLNTDFHNLNISTDVNVILMRWNLSLIEKYYEIFVHTRMEVNLDNFGEFWQ